MLPRLVVIVDRFTDPRVGDRAIAAAAAGAPWLMLRDREVEAAHFLESASALLANLRALDLAPFVSVTAQLDVARALHTNLHLGKHDVPIENARRLMPERSAIGYSAHSLAEAEAVAEAADYLFLSPVFRTSHRPGAASLGLDAIRRCAVAVGPTPVFALGGIDPSRAVACIEAGAHGIAVLSGVISADDVAGAVTAYLKKIR